jgi:hypothetical protein
MPERIGFYKVWIVAAALAMTAYPRQEREGVIFAPGLKGGLVRSRFVGQGVDVLEDQLREDFEILSDDPVHSYVAGAFVTIGFGENLALQPELLYHKNGTEYDGVFNGQSFDFNLYLEYLTLPMLFKLRLPAKGGSFRLDLYGAPQLSYRLKAEAEGLDELPATITRLGILDPVRNKTDITDQTRPIDFSFGLGTALQFRLGPGYLSLDFRYIWGYMDVFDADELTANAEEIKNKIMFLLLGYSFRL